jgi:RNA polymerase sigma-B factor
MRACRGDIRSVHARRDDMAILLRSDLIPPALTTRRRNRSRVMHDVRSPRYHDATRLGRRRHHRGLRLVCRHFGINRRHRGDGLLRRRNARRSKLRLRFGCCIRFIDDDRRRRSRCSERWRRWVLGTRGRREGRSREQYDRCQRHRAQRGTVLALSGLMCRLVQSPLRANESTHTALISCANFEIRSEMFRVATGKMSIAAAAERRLSHAQAAELQRAYHDRQDLGARARLIEAYLPLVRALAQRFAHRGERFEDLVQVGSIGLIKAVDRFEPERGVDFAAFAAPNISGEIRRHLRDRAGLIRVPRRQQETSARVSAVRRRLSGELRRSPTAAELAAAADVEQSDLLEATRVEDARAPVALTDAASAASSDDMFRATEDRVTVSKCLRRLHRREQQAVRGRFFADLSQTEIAARLGISETQTSRLIASGLAKLREDLEPRARFSASRQLNSSHGDSRRRHGRPA